MNVGTQVVVFGGERAVRLATQSALSDAGYRVRIASSPAELVKAMTEETRLLIALSPVQGASCAILSIDAANGTTDAADIVDRVRRRLQESVA